MVFGIIMVVAGIIGLVLFGMAGMHYLTLTLGALPLLIGVWRFKQLRDIKEINEYYEENPPEEPASDLLPQCSWCGQPMKRSATSCPKCGHHCF